MIWNAKNGTIPIGNTKMSYVSFGLGKKALILLPGLSDGLATVDGKTLLLAIPYKLFFKDYTLFMFSRKIICQTTIQLRKWRMIRQRQ